MKKLLYIIVLLHTWFCNAQNYQCLQPNVKHYFINDNNYLRGIRIDSAITTGDTVVYYPFKTKRIYPTDHTGGSWLGGKVIQLADGTFIFDDLWGDNVVIKTMANAGDAWLFYTDTTYHTYIAKVVSADTMTVLGTIDSVKKITITSYHGGMIGASDPVNNFSILLSKNNGFIKVFDLYTFPYSSPSTGHDSAGYDRYLDYVCDGYYVYPYPVPGTSEFTIVPYHIPSALAMYNFDVGDMFAGQYDSYPICPVDPKSHGIHYDSIISKTIVDSFHVDYAIHHLGSGANSYDYGAYTQPYSYKYIDTLHTDTSLVFLTQMPEEYAVSEYAYYYYPLDTTFCHLSPAYKFITPYVFEGCSFRAEFKEGFLPTYDTTVCTYSPCAMGDPIFDAKTDIMYYALINGVSCNSVILPPLAVNNITQAEPIKIFPDPARSQLTISAPEKISMVVISNLLGKVVYNHQYNSTSVQVDIADLPPAVYLVRINGTEIRRFVKQ